VLNRVMQHIKMNLLFMRGFDYDEICSCLLYGKRAV
jgi:hypothetical protein